MTFWKLFKAKSCSVRLKSNTKEGVLRELVDGLVGGGSLPEELADATYAALIEREELATTGVGKNVAIPHIKVEGIEKAIASLSVHPEGVEWSAIDGEPVQVLFAVVRPAEASDQHDPETHLEMMRWIARLGRDRDFRSFALQATKRSELIDLLKEMSAV